MPSKDIDGSPILILSADEARRVRIFLTAIDMLNDLGDFGIKNRPAFDALKAKFDRFVREAGESS